MKKFFALILVMSLLAFAGSAFASDVVGHEQNNNTPSTGGTTSVAKTTTAVANGTETIQAAVVAGDALAAASVHTGDQYSSKSISNMISAIVSSLSSSQIQAIVDALNTALDSLTKRQALFGTSITTDTTLQPNTYLTAVASTAGADANKEEQLAAASVNLTSNQRAIGAVGAVTPSVSGAYAFAQQFGSDLYKVKLHGDRNKKNNASNTTVKTAEADETGVAFLDSTGAPITAIPDGTGTATAGFVNMLVVMEAGNVYEPVIFTTVDSLSDDAGLTPEQIGTSKSYTVDNVEYTTSVTGSSGTDYNIPEKVKEKATGALNAAIYFADTTTHTLSAADYNSSKGVQVAAWLPAMTNVPEGTYFAATEKVSKSTASGYTANTNDTALSFYPNINGSAISGAKVYTEDGVEATSANIVDGKQLYVLFAVNAAGNVVAAADANLSEPAVTFKVVSTTGKTDPTGPSDSSGGCSTGFAALSLAVLGSFIATRKK